MRADHREDSLVGRQLRVDGRKQQTEKAKQDHRHRNAHDRPQGDRSSRACRGQVPGVIARKRIPRGDQREARHEAEHESAGVVGACYDRTLRPVELRRERQEQGRGQDGERDRAVCLEDLDRLVAEDSHPDADRSDHQHKSEGQPPVAASEELRPRLRRDDAVDGEPTGGQKEGQPGAEIRAAEPEDPAREDDLGQA